MDDQRDQLKKEYLEIFMRITPGEKPIHFKIREDEIDHLLKMLIQGKISIERKKGNSSFTMDLILEEFN